VNATRFIAAAVSAGLSAFTCVSTEPAASAASSVYASPPTGIGWSWDWDDDDDDWGQTATWECPAGCSITWEDDY